MAGSESLFDQLLESTGLGALRDAFGRSQGALGAESVELTLGRELEVDRGATLQVFDQPFDLAGGSTFEASYLGENAAVDPFATGAAGPLRTDRKSNTGLLRVSAAASLNGEVPFSAPAGARLSARAGAAGELRYRHYVAADESWKRSRAFRELVLGSRLPNLLELAEPMAHGEVHRLDSKLSLDFGLEASAGYEFAADTASSLSEGLAVDLKLSLEASLQAALGLGLFERMHLVVGRAHQLNPGWIRIRLQRASERRLSFGLTFSLGLKYDLGAVVSQLFEEAFDAVPTERLADAAKRIARYADLQELRARGARELNELLDELVTEGVVDTLDAALPFAKQVAEAYDGLDDTVQSLWDGLLSRADLREGTSTRDWLEKLKALDARPIPVDELLGDDELMGLLTAVEAITGETAEELLMSDTALQSALKRTSETAARALKFLDDTPDEVVAGVQRFARATGVEGTLEALGRVETREDLENVVSPRVRRFAGRVLGRAPEEITESDLGRIQAWAEKTAGLLDENHPQGLRARIAAQVERIEMDYGFAVGLEIDRVSRSTALLDLEVSPKAKYRKLRGRIGKALRLGDAKGVLEVLAEAGDMIDERAGDETETDATPAFVLRECAFVSERVRTTAVSTFFALAGWGKLFGGSQRVFNRVQEGSSLRVVDRMLTEPGVDGRAPDRFQRIARFTAGCQRGDYTGELDSDAAVWLVCEDSGSGLDLNRPFDSPGAETTLRLTATLEDGQLKPREAEALFALLSQLGFAPSQVGPETPAELLDLGQRVKLALDFRFGAEAVDRVLSALAADDGELLWNRAYLNACFRWYNERLVTRGPLSSVGRPTSLGEAMAHLLADSPPVRRELERGSETGFFLEFGGKSVTVDFASGGAQSFAIGEPKPNRATPLTGPLFSVVHRRRVGYKRFARRRPLTEAWAEAHGSRTLAAYEELMGRFTRAQRGASQRLGTRWPNSMFSIWLWLALVTAAAPELLESARGVAALRWKADNVTSAGGAQGWSAPMFWRLHEGVRDNLGRMNVFPFE